MSRQSLHVSQKGTPRKRVFAPEIGLLLYGCGDVEQPRQDTAALLEDLLHDYLVDTCLQAAAVAGPSRKVDHTHFLYVLRAHPKQVKRIEDLIRNEKEIMSFRRVPQTEANEGEEELDSDSDMEEPQVEGRMRDLRSMDALTAAVNLAASGRMDMGNMFTMENDDKFVDDEFDDMDELPEDEDIEEEEEEAESPPVHGEGLNALFAALGSGVNL